MTTTACDTVPTLTEWTARDEVRCAATRLYDAEVALHIARQTGVDPWIAAAYDRLHAAIAGYETACAALVPRAS